jgi:ribosome maturation factor RimP
MASTEDPELVAAVHDLAAPLAAARGMEILEVRVKGHKGSRMVRVVADVADLDADHDLDVDTVAELSRELGDALDEHDPIAGGYRLEVSSPGVDRPLTRPRDFRRNVGRQVRVELTSDADAPSELTGTLVDATDTEITLEDEAGSQVVPLGTIARGHVVLPW